jgi:predicted transcriptional regulator
MDSEISKKLDAICVRHGDVTWHIENALTEYMANRKNVINELAKAGKETA